MMSIFKFFVFAICVSGIIFFAEHSAVAQSQKVNSVTRSFEAGQPSEQQPQVEAPISRKQVIIRVVITAGIAICEQSRKCSNYLNNFREILNSGQPSVSPPMFNRPTRRLSLSGNKRMTFPF